MNMFYQPQNTTIKINIFSFITFLPVRGSMHIEKKKKKKKNKKKTKKKKKNNNNKKL